MDGLLTRFDQFQIIESVWGGATVPEAFQEHGHDFAKLYPFLDVDFCRFLIDVASVAMARDRGCGIIPGQGFVS